MKYKFLLIFLLFSNTIFAQETLIPYRKGQLWGFADTTAKIILKPKFTKVDLYNNNSLYKVYIGDNCGIINSKRKTVVPIIYSQINNVDKSNGFIAKKDNKYFFYTSKGKNLFKDGEEKIYSSTNGTINITRNNKLVKYDYVNKKVLSETEFGNEEISVVEELEESPYFTDRTEKKYQIVNIGNKKGICNVSTFTKGFYGKISTETKSDTLNFMFDNVKVYNYFHLNFALVKNNNLWGFFYEDELLIPTEYEYISDTLINNKCSEFFLKVKKNSKFGIIDISGNVIIDFIYDNIFSTVTLTKYGMHCSGLNNGIVAMKNGKLGLIAPNNSVILDFKYDKIEFSLSNVYFEYFSGDKKGISSERFKINAILEKSDICRSVKTIDNFMLLEIKYPDGKLKGYAGKNNILFYED